MAYLSNKAKNPQIKNQLNMILIPLVTSLQDTGAVTGTQTHRQTIATLCKSEI